MMWLSLVVPSITSVAFMSSGLVLLYWQTRCRCESMGVRFISAALSLSLCLVSLEILLYRPSVSLWHASTGLTLFLLFVRGKARTLHLLGKPESC